MLGNCSTTELHPIPSFLSIPSLCNDTIQRNTPERFYHQQVEWGLLTNCSFNKVLLSSWTFQVEGTEQEGLKGFAKSPQQSILLRRPLESLSVDARNPPPECPFQIHCSLVILIQVVCENYTRNSFTNSVGTS
jgi:hypothetical protein